MRAVLLTLVVFLPYLSARRLYQQKDAIFPEKLLQLTEGDALEGDLPGPSLQFGLSVQAQNGTFPDILLTLEIVNRANADLFCAPYNETVPISENRWSSESTQGMDFLFISTQSAYYSQAIRPADDQTAAFLCTLERASFVDPVYYVEMDVSYERRTLRDIELEAMQNIYSTCCANAGDCLGWIENWHSVQIEQKNKTLEVTDFDFCHVTGNVCDEKGYLLKLNMDGFGLNCPFPGEEISKLERLQKLSMKNNELSGGIYTISQYLENLEDLDEIRLSNNFLTGTLSKEEVETNSTNPFCSLVERRLLHLHLGFNAITGPLPECLFSGSSSLRELILDNNPISGIFPDAIEPNNNLEFVSMFNTNMSGPFPTSFVNSQHLVYLDLSYNNLESEIVDEFGPNSKIRYLYLNHNQFTGTIPSGIAASVTLETILLDHNRFTGMPAQWLTQGPITPLVNLDISFNEIDDVFPVALSLSPHLSALKMNDNKFYGPLPTISQMFPNAWIVNASSNQLGGELPSEWTQLGMFLGTATKLPYTAPSLDLSYNLLAGRVPSFFFHVENYPEPLLDVPTVHLEGNNFDCPEVGTSDHLIGFENCDSIYGETEFNIQSNGGSPSNKNSDAATVATLAGESDKSSKNSETILIIIGSIVIGIVGISVLVGFAIRFHVFRSIKDTVTNPSKDEMAGAKPEPMDSSKNLEQSKLNTGVQSAPL